MKKLLLFILLSIAGNAFAQNGITWNMGINLATSSSGNEHPRIAVDGNNNPMVIWHHTSSAMFSRWNGTSFTAPVMLNPAWMTIAGASWMGPDIATHGDTVYVVFKQSPEASDTCHIYCVSSFDGGVSFNAPVVVDHISDSISRFPTVTTDAAGNPLVGFMKFNSSFAEARWVVAKSNDFGNTFSLDVKASGWSSGVATVCDCCPGSIACADNKVAMLYRDNNNNVRDTWVGFSNDTATSFSYGLNVDQQNWNLFACPSTGPDGIIIGDTLYAAFMNGASGMSTVYYSKSSISTGITTAGVPITGSISGLSQQNYPRIAASGNAIAMVWQQVVNGMDECALRFTNNSVNGFNAGYVTVDMSNVTNADVALSNGNIFVVWQDNNSATIKYRSGTYTPVTTSLNALESTSFTVYPNPVSSVLNITSSGNQKYFVTIYNSLGETIYGGEQTSNLQLETANFPVGIYFLQLLSNNKIISYKFIKQ